MKGRFYLALLAPSLLFTGIQSRLCQGDEVLDWLDDNAALVAVASRPDLIVAAANDTDRWWNENWSGVGELFLHSEFPIIAIEQVESAQRIWTEVTELLENVDEVAFVAHSIGLNDLRFSLLIKSDQEEAVSSVLDGLITSFSGVDSGGPLGFLRSIDNISFKKAGNWLVVSNSQPHLNAIAARIVGNAAGNSSFRSMTASRKYQMVEQFFLNAPEDYAVLRLFGNPARLRPLFVDISDERWRALQINELPSFGVQVLLFPRDNASEGSEATEDLWLAIDGAVNFTVPLTGLGALVDSFRPIDIAVETPWEVAYAKVKAFDPGKSFAAEKVLFEDAPDTASYEEYLRSRYPEEYFGDIVASRLRRTDLQAIFGIEANPSGTEVSGSMVLERVNSRSEAEDYFRGLVERTNDLPISADEKYQQNDTDGDDLVFAKPSGGGDKPGAAEAVVLTQEWHMQGKMRHLMDMRDFLEEDSRDSQCDVEPQLRRLERESNIRNAPFMVEWRSMKVGVSHATQFEYDRLLQKYPGNDGWEKRHAVLDEPDNEYGYRMTIESVEDRDAVLAMLIRKAIARSIGDMLTHYSWNGTQLRIVRGFYRNIGDSAED